MLCKFCDRFRKKALSVLLFAPPDALLKFAKLCCNWAKASVAVLVLVDELALATEPVLEELELNWVISACKLLLNWLLDAPSL